MSEAEAKSWKNFSLKISLGQLVATLGAVIAATWLIHSWIETKFDQLLERLQTIENRVLTIELGKPVTQTQEANPTINVLPQKTQAEMILARNPETLTVKEIAAIQGVTERTILNYIIQVEGGGSWYTDRDGTKWRALKVGKSWIIQNPYLAAAD